MITGARILICNDYELEMIRRAVGLDNNGLLEHVESIIVTLGEQGSRVVASTGETAVAAVKARDVADPTGAGDAYRSGLLKGLVMGKPLPEAAQLGSTCASFAVEHLGTQEHHFTEDEFWARHKQAFGSA
jgi:adenosine kinase